MHAFKAGCIEQGQFVSTKEHALAKLSCLKFPYLITHTSSPLPYLLAAGDSYRWWDCQPVSSNKDKSTPAAPSGPLKSLPQYAQCGGMKGSCTGTLCKDSAFAGYQCGNRDGSLECMRQNRCVCWKLVWSGHQLEDAGHPSINSLMPAFCWQAWTVWGTLFPPS